MRKFVLSMAMLPVMALGQTLEECQMAAERNYPLIRQYGLIERTTALTVANIQKGWLPQVSASAQATYQSDEDNDDRNGHRYKRTYEGSV